MATLKIKPEVEKAIYNSLKVKSSIRINFTLQRNSLFGKFAKLSDHDELMAKGMIRFVSVSRLDEFYENPNIGHTRILVMSDFQSVVLF